MCLEKLGREGRCLVKFIAWVITVKGQLGICLEEFQGHAGSFLRNLEGFLVKFRV